MAVALESVRIPNRYRDLVARAQRQIERRLALYHELAGRAGGHA
jgi:hypothetical protein